MKASTLRRGLNLWPPFLFAGIHVTEISPDWKRIRVELRMRPWNRNYVKTHFGGSLFAMTDPFVMLLAMQRLGREFLVWDQAAEIVFLKAVREDVFVEFHMDDHTVADLRAAAASGDKVLRWFELDIRTASGERVAQVRKQLYVRRKPARAAD